MLMSPPQLFGKGIMFLHIAHIFARDWNPTFMDSDKDCILDKLRKLLVYVLNNNTMNCISPSSSVLHYLLEFVQIHVH